METTSPQGNAIAAHADAQSAGQRLLAQYAYRAETHAQASSNIEPGSLSLEQLSALAFAQAAR